MRVFNLAEELEKERKKNKKLQEDLNKYVCYYRYVKMEKESLQDRIDKVIEYIEKKYYKKVYKTKGTSINDLLNILKGE